MPRTDFPHLTPESVVWDVGAYEGHWSRAIKNQYGSKVHAFEPVPEYAARCRERLPDCDVHEYALGGRSRKEWLQIEEDASTIINGGDIEIEVCRFDSIMRLLKVEELGLVKINVEGAEYEIMERLLGCGEMHRIKHLLIQFHPFVEHAHERYNAICAGLIKTHTPLELSFTWDHWAAK